MSDHVHDCSGCTGYWTCDNGDGDECAPGGLCRDCLAARVVELEKINADTFRMWEEDGDNSIRLCRKKDLVIERLNTRAAELEAEIERLNSVLKVTEADRIALAKTEERLRAFAEKERNDGTEG